jgi:serine/threonine protein kinase
VRLTTKSYLTNLFCKGPTGASGSSARRTRFQLLDHPNICSIYEFDQYEGHPFIVMQLLQGKTLRDQ